VLEKDCITIGRIGGQYAKPRSIEYEIINNEKKDNYRGDIVNDFDPKGYRESNPDNLLKAYYNSMTTM